MYSKKNLIAAFSGIGIILFSNVTIGQNLVKNPSFESYTYCPSYFNNHPPNVTDGWFSPDAGTPDYYNKCSKNKAGVPYNWAGVSDAKTGIAYAGIYAYRPDYREYLQTKLSKPLEANTEYIIRFYYKQSSNSEYLTGDIGVFITGKTLDNLAVPIDTTLNQTDSISYNLADNWRLFEKRYRAKGGENIITIGNYRPANEMKKIKVDFRYIEEAMLTSSSYFYIDDVSVMSIDAYKEEQRIDSIISNINFGAPIALKNVLFEFNSDSLKKEVFPQLDSLSEMLKNYPLRIKLRGFTDSIGSPDYNQRLSYKRAVSVGKYLVDKGVAPSRIKPVGYGEGNPLTSNSSDNERQLNRRVEFVLYPSKE